MRTLPQLLVLSLLCTGSPSFAQTPVDPTFAALLQQKLDSCKNVYSVPGISATVLLPGDRFWNGTSGVADILTEEPLDTFHVFQAASVTKLFTATIVFQLIEEGILQLDDTLGSYLPPMVDIPGNIKLRYLLNHRSGLAELLQQPGAANNWFSAPDSIWPAAQVVATYHAPPLFAPNANFSYANTNYVLLGMVIGSVTGQSYAEQLDARILQPLGMENTYFPPTIPITGALTPGWTSFTQVNTYDTDCTPVLRDCFASFVSSAGAIATTPNDLARFTRAVMTGELLSASSLATMRTCTNVNFGDGSTGYGHGAARSVFAGRTYYGHGGDISGFTQMTAHCEDDSVTITLSINRNNAPRGPIAAAMLTVVHQGLSTGIDRTDHALPTFDLFPIPSVDQVTIRSSALRPGDRIEVVDATGRTMRILRSEGREAQVISLKGLASGTCWVRWTSAQGPVTRPLIIH